MSMFKAGSATEIVYLDESCFPNAEAISKHDDVCVRALILETEERFAIMTVDVPSIFPDDIELIKSIVGEHAKIKPQNIWAVASHSLSAPHTWPLGENKQKDSPVPEAIKTDADMRKKAVRINEAYVDAYKRAIITACQNLVPARMGFGLEACSINVNRNMPTVEGWWQGVNFKGFVDHELPVIRIDNLNGNPIAVLFNFSVQPSACAGSIPGIGGRLSSSDITGFACKSIEEEFSGCTAMFLPGATGDQVPLYKVNYIRTNKDGKIEKGSFGVEGYVLVEAQGVMLGNCVVNAVRNIEDFRTDISISSSSRQYTVQCQKRETDMSRMRPCLDFTFLPNGQRTLEVYALVIGDVALVGLHPEMDGSTIAGIRHSSPFEKTMAVTFVNGNAKTMPERGAYELFQYTAMNSPFVAGSAEKSASEALKLLEEARS